MGCLAKTHAREHTQVNQARLLRAADQVHLQAQLVLQGRQELAAVGGLAHGAGGGGDDLLHPLAMGQVTAVAQG